LADSTENVKVKILADVSGLKKSLDKLDTKNIDLSTNFDKVKADLKGIKADLTNIGSRTPKVSITSTAKEVTTDIKRLATAAKSLNTLHPRITISSNAPKISKDFGTIIGLINSVGNKKTSLNVGVNNKKLKDAIITLKSIGTLITNTNNRKLNITGTVKLTGISKVITDVDKLIERIGVLKLLSPIALKVEMSGVKGSIASLKSLTGAANKASRAVIAPSAPDISKRYNLRTMGQAGYNSGVQRRIVQQPVIQQSGPIVKPSQLLKTLLGGMSLTGEASNPIIPKGFLDTSTGGIFQNIGRASKGLGSMYEVLGKVLNTLNASDSATMRWVGKFAAVALAAGSVGLVLNGIYTAVTAVAEAIGKIVMPGFNFASDMEVAKLGIAGTISSMGQLNGKAIDFNDATKMSSKLMEELNIDAIRTSATTQDLVRTYQGIAAPGLGAGMDLEQIRKFTTVGVNTAKAMGLGSAQYIQELRDLTQGGIQAASSTIATSLGLKDADIAKAKTSAQGLFAFLMERMKGYEEASKAFPLTFKGIFDQLGEFATLASNALVKKFEPQIKAIGIYMQSIFGSISEEGGTHFEISPNIVAGINDIVAVIEVAKSAFKSMMSLFGSYDVDGTFYISQDTLDVYNTIKSIFGDIYTIIVELASSDSWQIMYDFAIAVAERLMQWADVFLKIIDEILPTIISLFDDVTGAITPHKTLINMAVDALMGFFILEKIIVLANLLKLSFVGIRTMIGASTKAVALLKTALLAITKNPIMLALSLGVMGVTALLGDKIMNKISGISETPTPEDNPPEEKNPNKEKEDKDLADKMAGVTSKYHTDEDDKAKKKELKDAQLALKLEQQEVKTFLEKQLEEYKRSLDIINNLYKQGMASFQDMTAAEAQNSVNTEQANVDALQKQIDNVNNTQFKDEQTRTDALDNLTQQLGKHQRALEEATNAQREVTEVIGAFNEHSMGENNTLNAGSPTGAGIPQGSSPEEGALYLAYKNLKSQDTTGQLTYDLVLGMAEQESSRRHWNDDGSVKTSDDGGIGLMQLTSDHAISLADNGNPYDMQSNANGGVRYLIELLNKYGSKDSALYHYNGSGPAAEKYVKKVNQKSADLLSRATDLLNAPLVASTLPVTPQGEGTNFVREQGVDIEDLTQNGVQALNLLSAKYKELSGLPLGVSEGYSTNPIHGVGGHDSGNKLDLVDTMDDSSLQENRNGIRDKIIDYAESIGIVVGDEYAHPSPNSTGGHIDINAKDISQGATMASNLPVVTTDAGLKAKEGLEKLEKTHDETLQAYLELYSDFLTIPIKQLREATNKKKQAYVSENRPDLAQKEEVLYNVKARTLVSTQAKKTLDLSISDLDNSETTMAGMIANNIYSAGDAIDRYNQHFKTTGIMSQINKLQSLEREALKSNDLTNFWNIHKMIKDARESLDGMGEKFKKAVEDEATYQTNMINANYDMTDRQKTKANQVISSNSYTQKAQIATGQLIQYNKEYNEAASFADKMAILYDKIYPTEKVIALNKQLAKIPTLLEEVHQSSKQAFEDGLLSFLTDGINDAKSLGDALNSMVLSILKSMQKVLAQSITDQWMNRIFPSTDNSKVAKKDTGYNILDSVAPAGQGILDYNPLAKTTGKGITGYEPMADSVSTMTAFNSAVTTTTEYIKNSLKQALAAVSSATADITSSTATNTGNGNTGSSSDYSFDWSSLGLTKYATGGAVYGAGTSTSDSIPTMLSHGEFVVRAQAARNIGYDVLDSINSGSSYNMKIPVKGYANGGAIGDVGAQTTARGVTSFAKSIGTNVNANANLNIALVKDQDEATEHFMRSTRGQNVLVDMNKSKSKLLSQVLKMR